MSGADLRGRPAPDASMDLLNAITRQPVDPDYARVSARGEPPPRRRWAVAGVLLLSGLLLAVSALQTSRRAPVLATERTELISRIQAAQQRQDALRQQAAGLTADITRLRTAAVGTNAQAKAREALIAEQEPVVGAAPVTGPGVVVTVDDAPSGNTSQRDRVLDLDLQLLVNGLWQAGAEAVAVNGHRLSALSAIRGAGEAITVDYSSLTRPYRVEAIGDPRTLPAKFAESSGGGWWHELSTNRGMQFETTTAEQLTLPADPGMVLRYARPGQ